MSGPFVFQPHPAQVRTAHADARAHDLGVLRAQTRKHAERLRALAGRAALRLKGRPELEKRS